QFEQAIVAYRQAIKLREDELEYRRNLVAALAAGDRGDEAAEAGREVVARWPESPVAQSILAAGLAAAGKFQDAEAACRKSVALAPDNPKSHHQLALALRDLGRFDDALAEF